MRRTGVVLAILVLACGPAAAPEAPRPRGPAGVSPAAAEPSAPAGSTSPPAGVGSAATFSGPAPPSGPGVSESDCVSDADCLLATRASLGCCDPCPGVEAMTPGRRDEIARLCGLAQGGETCPRTETPVECVSDDPALWRAACVEGRCTRLRR